MMVYLPGPPIFVYYSHDDGLCHVGTSQIICTVNRLIGLHMMRLTSYNTLKMASGM